MKHIRLISILIALALGGVDSVMSDAQERQRKPGGWLEYSVENGDTIFYDSIRPARVFQKMPKQKGKEWRKYYRLVHNFSKAYPYALVAKRMGEETGLRKERYINHLQKELFGVFEKQMRNLTVTQGMLIMKLIDRETGHTSYELIRGYKGGITAGFWQGVARMFDEDMKKRRLSDALLVAVLERPSSGRDTREIPQLEACRRVRWVSVRAVFTLNQRYGS